MTRHWPAVALALSCAVPCRPARLPDLPQAVAQVISRSNVFRVEQGLPPVEPDAQLTAAAEAYAAYLARTDRFSHTADGREPWDRAKAQGYAMCMIAENLALEGSSAGFATAELAQDFVQGWIDSPGHRHNLLSPEATQTGVAIAHGARSDRYYAVQMFGRPESRRITFEVGNRSTLSLRYRVGDEAFPLPPRVRRTHELCADKVLEVEVPGRDAPIRVTPANGAHYRFESTPKGVRFAGG